ncbi:probable prolyl 4-hydroxylase 6 [Impatiens glandulifera]|uniref:probable prolyl 4-hydroxylase 6 n=1 Tax=Impatiens glandulifera TaxID=253017 RepID=UPI001FB11E23|nr:probable prolyl 4-hydroxylase 6 [Impatiens glandulifera]
MDSPLIFIFLVSLLLLLLLPSSSSSFKVNPSRVTPISWHPRAFIYKGFLSDDECDHLISLAGGKLEKSMVTGDKDDESVLSLARTSSGMFLLKAQDKIVADIEKRIASWTFLPEENGESLQILRYKLGERYVPHYDYFSNEEIFLGPSGNRIATVLMYLTTVHKGGETVFPYSDSYQVDNKCGYDGYAVKARKGDALLFFSLHPNSTADSFSLHESCPVIEGEKWSATKWIHARSYNKKKNDDDCEDKNSNCPSLAAKGECIRDSVFMVGSQHKPGICRKSCRVCTSNNNTGSQTTKHTTTHDQ